MKTTLAALAIATIALCNLAQAQTYKVDYATKVVLAGGTTDPANTLTLKAPALGAGGWSLSFPAAAAGTNGFVLTGNTDGTTQWANLSSLGVTSVVGTSPINVNTVSGTATVSITHGDLTTSGTGLSVTGGTGAVIGAGSQISLATGALSVPGIFTTSGTGVMAGSTFTVSLATQSANTIFAGPTTGAAAVPTFRPMVTADIPDAAVTYAKIQNVGASSLFGNPTGVGAAGQNITLDPTLKFSGTTLAIDLAHNNTWTGTQTINGAGKLVYGDGFAASGKVLQAQDASGTAKWVDLSSFGVTSVVGTSPINVNTVSGTATVSITHGDLTTSGTGLSVTGGTGAVIGSGSQVSLATGALSVPGIFTTSGTGVMAGSTFTVDLATQSANTIFAGPTTGAAAAPTFRPMVTADIPDAAVTYAKIQNVGASSLFGNSTTSGATGQDITLDASLKFSATTPGSTLAINLANNNTWTGAQTFNTATTTINGPLKYTNGTINAGWVLTTDGSGNASWASLSGLGVTSVVGTSPINVSTVSGTATVSITHGDLTATSPINVTGGTGAVIGSGAAITVTSANLTSDPTTSALTVTGGTGVILGSSDASVSLATDATLQVASSQLGLKLSNQNTWTGMQGFGATTFTSSSPLALASNTNNWGLSASNSYFKISSSANVTVSSITGGVDGRVIVLVNTGSNYITFINDDGASGTDINRFKFQGGNNIIVGPDGNLALIYDATASGTGRWRMLYAN